MELNASKVAKTLRTTEKRNEKKWKENAESRKLQFSAEKAKKAKCASRTQPTHTYTHEYTAKLSTHIHKRNEREDFPQPRTEPIKKLKDKYTHTPSGTSTIN